jgi:hypothetical protein
LVDDDGRHLMRSLEIATSRGTPADLALTNELTNLRIRVGDPDLIIDGLHAYRMTYVLEDVVTTLPDGRQRVRLDAVNGWDQPIIAITHQIVTDKGTAAPTSRCWAGPEGSVSACTEGLAAGDAYTTESIFPPGTFDSEAVTHIDPTVRWAVVAGLLMLAAVPGAAALTWRRERTTRRQAAALATGIVTIDPAAIEFSPPLGLDPASSARLLGARRADIGRLAAVIVIDMMANRTLITEREGDDWRVRRGPVPPRTPHEDTLTTAILGEQDEVVLGARSGAIGSALRAVAEQLDDGLRERGLISSLPLPAVPAATKGGQIILTVIACASSLLATAFVVPVASLVVDQRWIVLAVAALTVTIVLLLGARHDRRRCAVYTDAGRAAVWRLEGFRRFFEQSEFTHVEAADRMGMFREYAGYAAAFGALDRWVRAIPLENPGNDVTWRNLPLMSQSGVWRNAARASMPHASSARATHSGSGSGAGGGGGGSW